VKKPVDPRLSSISCLNVIMEMDYPRSVPQIESFLWYIYHDTEVYVGKDGRWYLKVPSRCSRLSKEMRCTVSVRQPGKCSEFAGNGATSLDDVAKARFRTERELLAYLKARRPALFKKLRTATRRMLSAEAPAKSAPVKKKPSLPSETATCVECKGLCCTYLNIVVDRPVDQEDVEELLWYQYHASSDLHLDTDGEYSVLFRTPCHQLDKNYLCKIYTRRPSICRQFSINNCHGSDFDNSVKIHFDSEEKLLGHLKQKRPGLFKRLPEKLRALARRVPCPTCGAVSR